MWTSSDEAQSLFEQMSLCPKLIHSQADSFTSEFYPSRGSCGYALLLSSGNVPVTGALPDPPLPASKWTSSDEAQSLFEQMSLCPKLIHSQADSFTSEFYPSRGSCGYALLLEFR